MPPAVDAAHAFAAAFEVFLDTATEDALGAGTTAFGPQAFFVRFFQPGTLTPGGGLFAPGFQYKFDVDKEAGRDDTDQFLIDLNLLVMAKDKQSWFFTDPQIVIDFEANEEYCVCDFEFGWMMSKWFDGFEGQSFYVRPSVGIGDDRPTDGAIEVGYKIVGW